MSTRKEKNIYWLSSAPVARALVALSIPTIVSQMIAVIYNLADTLFIGRLNDPSQVAAVTYTLSLMILFNAVANLFGVGGSAFIAHALGRGDRNAARKAASFALFSGLALSVIYMFVIAAFQDAIYPALGATGDSLRHVREYAFFTVVLGTLPAVMNPLLAHLLRGEGHAFGASFGVALGGILNILLDPLFIFAMGMEVAGAGLATFLSNVIACVFLIIYTITKRSSTVVNMNPKNVVVGKESVKEILAAGLPNFVISIMASSSNMVGNYLFSSYGDQIVAGWGIARKIDILAFAIAQGMTQGSLPLISYAYSSKKKERLFKSIKLSFAFAMVMGVVGALLLFFLARPASQLFIEDETTVFYAEQFTRILSITCITTAPAFMVITVFQSMGRRWQPFFLSFFRKGVFNIIFSIIFSFSLGEYGIAAATPAADFLAMCVSLTLFFIYYRKFKAEMEVVPSEEPSPQADNS